MITMAILGIITAMALPPMAGYVAQKALDNEADELYAHIIYARNVAVSGDIDVIVCPSADGSTCSKDWSKGWIVFEDHDSNGDMNTGDVILRVREDDVKSDVVAGADDLRFVRSGRVFPSNSMQFSFCNSINEAVKAKGVSITATGNTRTALPSDDDCA
jgi:type IV fimbrial biogenesis protein FimT